MIPSRLSAEALAAIESADNLTVFADPTHGKVLIGTPRSAVVFPPGFALPAPFLKPRARLVSHSCLS